MNLNELKTKIAEVVQTFRDDWISENGLEDFGTCGSAIVLLGFGRKTKLKNQFLTYNLISENNTWDYCGKKYYVLNFDRSSHTQNACFYDGMANAAKQAVVDYTDEIDVVVHSWID